MNLMNMDGEVDQNYQSDYQNINLSKWRNIFSEEKFMLMNDLQIHINVKVSTYTQYQTQILKAFYALLEVIHALLPTTVSENE